MVCATLDLLQHARFNVEQWVMRRQSAGGNVICPTAGGPLGIP